MRCEPKGHGGLLQPLNTDATRIVHPQSAHPRSRSGGGRSDTEAHDGERHQELGIHTVQYRDTGSTTLWEIWCDRSHTRVPH